MNIHADWIFSFPWYLFEAFVFFVGAAWRGWKSSGQVVFLKEPAIRAAIIMGVLILLGFPMAFISLLGMLLPTLLYSLLEWPHALKEGLVLSLYSLIVIWIFFQAGFSLGKTMTVTDGIDFGP